MWNYHYRNRAVEITRENVENLNLISKIGKLENCTFEAIFRNTLKLDSANYIFVY